MNNDPREFPLTDDNPENNGNGYDWSRLEEFYEEKEKEFETENLNAGLVGGNSAATVNPAAT